MTAGTVIIGLWLQVNLLQPRPFWAYSGDAGNSFYYNSLTIVRGHAPVQVTQPETPVQVLGAGIAAFVGPTPENAPRFLILGRALVLVLVLGAIAWWSFSRLSGLVPIIGVAVVLSLLAHPAFLWTLEYWSPEAFFFPLAVAGTAMLWRALGKTERKTAWILATGAVSGFACAVKLAMLPFLLGSLVALCATQAASRGGWRPS